uniref:Uncharacterized protein n=1 Tax=Parascaris equorum TaxID=6256 RepID=A0A914RCS8_PAREQ
MSRNSTTRNNRTEKNRCFLKSGRQTIVRSKFLLKNIEWNAIDWWNDMTDGDDKGMIWSIRYSL